MFVHGGGYCCGDKSEIRDSVITWANRQGYTFIAVNYRLRVVYPAFDEDIASAINWVRTNAATFGADGARIALMGHSTGGSMVAELATTPSLYANESDISALSCVLLLDPSVLDLAARVAVDPNRGGAQMIRAAYGTSEAGWRAASALNNADDTNNVAKLLIATRGNHIAENRRFADLLRSNGTAVQEIDASAINHGQVLNDIGRTGDRIMTAPVQSFLNDCLGAVQKTRP